MKFVEIFAEIFVEIFAEIFIEIFAEIFVEIFAEIFAEIFGKIFAEIFGAPTKPGSTEPASTEQEKRFKNFLGAIAPKKVFGRDGSTEPDERRTRRTTNQTNENGKI